MHEQDRAGADDSYDMLNEELESSNINWFELRLFGKVPERRGYHSTFIHKNKMYIYGGHDIREGSLDNLWMIDMNNFNDLDMQPEDQEKCCEWKLLEPKGNVHPGAISHHTSIVYSDKMYLFGGSKASGQENKHFYSFNIDKL